MAAGKHNFVIEKGATFNPIIVWKDSLLSPVDLTGFTAEMEIRPSPGSPITYYRLSSDTPSISIGTTDGSISLLIPATDTINLHFKSAFYDLFLTSGSGVVTRLLEGKVELIPNVTQ